MSVTTDMEGYLHSNIPLSAAMGVQVRVATPVQVVLRAPLAPNINHQHTVFGGSGVVLSTLSAWSLLHMRLQHEQIGAQVVIQRSSMEYERPIYGDFEARCRFDDGEGWKRFRALLARRGRARLRLRAELLPTGAEAQVMGVFVGDFVALMPAA